ncbi:MAG: 4-phosphopantetheinyl transferase family protein [Winogradskyella sp.]|nr:MAG: 4-phosphopantetheinyl transferase family protein [Winogradskyella sp.]
MVGNDIVDIAQAKKESNWQRPRFLDKLFTEKEQQIIHSSENSFLIVWRLWSMKEAAYKLYTQCHPSRFYNPKKFECIIDGNSGIVKFQNFKCYVVTKTTSDYIVSESSLKLSKLKSKVVKLDSECLTNQSEFLKRKLITSASKRFYGSEVQFNIKKNNHGVPAMEFNNRKVNISLTHHGNYGAYAIA